MKHTRYLKAASLCFAGLSICTQSTAGAYRDSTNGFSLSPPEFGVAKNVTAQVAIFGGPVVDGFSPNCNVQIQFMQGTLAQYEALSLKQFENHGWVMLDASSPKVSGQPALRWHYTGALNGKSFEWAAIVTARANKFYLLTCTALKGRFAESRAAFDKTLASFAVD